MKETRVQKYQNYRDSFTKKDSSFSTPKIDDKVNTNSAYLSLMKKKKIENLMLVIPMVAILIAIVVGAIIVF